MKSQLAIELSENSVKFTTIQDGLVETSDSFVFKEKIDYQYKEQLERIFQEKKYKEREFDDYSLSWYSPLSTLIPSNVFSEVKPEDIFNLSFSKNIPLTHIDYNRIPELSLVNIFEIPLWVKSFFVIKFPRIVIQNEGSFLLRSIFKSSSSKSSTLIIIHEDSFNLILTDKNELQFYSNFNYLNSDDIIYHVLFSLQQKNMFNENNSISLLIGSGSNEECVNEVKLKLLKFKEIVDSKVEINKQILLNSHIQCV